MPAGPKALQAFFVLSKGRRRKVTKNIRNLMETGTRTCKSMLVCAINIICITANYDLERGIACAFILNETEKIPYSLH